jgi:MFS family permease
MCAGPSAPCSSRHHHQLHGSPGSGASQAHPHAERCQSWHRPDRSKLRDRRSVLYLFYALGQLGAGRFVDKVGTRLGYMVIMALWSLSAMGHALVNSVLQLGIARSCLGIGESGNFPAANKTNAEWFPQKSARSLSASSTAAPMSASSWLRSSCRSNHYFGWHAAFLVTGFFSASWIFCGSSNTTSPPNIPRSPPPNLPTSTRTLQRSPAHPHHGSNCLASARHGPTPSQVPHRSHLVVLPLLAAGLLQR